MGQTEKKCSKGSQAFSLNKIFLSSVKLNKDFYLSKLGWIAPLDPSLISLLKSASFAVNALALFVAAFIIFKNLIKGLYEEKRLRALEVSTSSVRSK